MGGWLTVVESRTEARLRARIDRLRERVDGLYSVLARRVTGNQERTDGLQARVERLEDEVARGRAELAVRVAQLEGKARKDDGMFDDAGSIVAVLVLAVLAFISIGRGRRRDDDLVVPPHSDVVLGGQDIRWRTEAAEEAPESISVGGPH